MQLPNHKSIFLFSCFSAEDEDSELSAVSSSSMATETETDDSDVVGSSRGRIMPLRRSARNRRMSSDEGHAYEPFFSHILV